jgi:hypothetical protein
MSMSEVGFPSSRVGEEESGGGKESSSSLSPRASPRWARAGGEAAAGRSAGSETGWVRDSSRDGDTYAGAGWTVVRAGGGKSGDAGAKAGGGGRGTAGVAPEGVPRRSMEGLAGNVSRSS